MVIVMLEDRTESRQMWKIVCHTDNRQTYEEFYACLQTEAEREVERLIGLGDFDTATLFLFRPRDGKMRKLYTAKRGE